MNKKHFYTAVVLLLFLAIGIQPAFAQWFITPGDDPANKPPEIGEWNASSRTFTLTTDLSEGLVIEDGVMTLDGAGHTIKGTITTNYPGIEVRNVHTITILNIYITGFQDGIAFSGVTTSHDHRVENCAIYSNTNTGITILVPDTNTLKNNTIDSNPVGIFLANDTDNNAIYNNTISNNGTGISITGNANNNNIYSNNFISNATQAKNFGIDNVFNLSAEEGGGNYWDDYTGVDSDGDGFGDTAYDNGYGVIDYLPLVPSPQTPQEVIENVILVIEQMNVPEDAEKEMEKAVKELKKAIKELEKGKIDKTIKKIEKAVKQLEKASDKGADTQNVIDMLDELLQEL